MFSTEKEYIYDKSPEETFEDLKNALEKIGSVKAIDSENGNISGKARYGLQKAKIEAKIEAFEGKTKIIFKGKSDDVQGIGAQKVIERLFETMKNLDNPEFTPSKSGISLGQIAANLVAVIVAILIGILIENEWIGILVLAVSVYFINYFYSKSKQKK